MNKIVWACYRQAGICPSCGRPAVKGRVYCGYHMQKQREAGKRAYYRNKDREKADPEYHEAQKIKRRNRQTKHRAKLRAQNRCYVCGKPATHGVYCTEHWIENVTHGHKANYQPFAHILKVRPKLPIPQVSDRVRIDVGKLIALYNAGWSYKAIMDEMKIGETTISRYVAMARKLREEETTCGQKS